MEHETFYEIICQTTDRNVNIGFFKDKKSALSKLDSLKKEKKSNPFIYLDDENDDSFSFSFKSSWAGNGAKFSIIERRFEK